MIIFFCSNTFETIRNGPAKFVHKLLNLNWISRSEIHLFTEDVATSDPSRLINKVNVRKKGFAKHLGMLTRIKDYDAAIQKKIKSGLIPDLIVYNNAIVGIKSFQRNVSSIGMINDYISAQASIKSLGFGKTLIRHKVFQELEKIASRTSNCILVNSHFMANVISKNYPDSLGKIKIMYKGINVPQESFRDTKLNSPIKILFVKSDWKIGGLDILISALSKIANQFLLYIVGPNINDIPDKLLTNRNIKVQLLGPIGQAEVFRLYKTSDIFCTPSRFEALGVAHIEALAFKIPVVYSNTGGLPEVMNFGKNGFPSEPENISSLIKAFIECIGNQEMRIEKSANGYKHIKENFTEEKMIKRFIQVCHEVVAS